MIAVLVGRRASIFRQGGPRARCGHLGREVQVTQDARDHRGLVETTTIETIPRPPASGPEGRRDDPGPARVTARAGYFFVWLNGTITLTLARVAFPEASVAW